MAGPWEHFAAPQQQAPTPDGPWTHFAGGLGGAAAPQGVPGASYDTVDAEMRAVVSKLPDDRSKQQALEQLLRNRGIPDPKIQGSGRDWFMLDPKSGGLKALTNTPEWDRYDAIEGALELPRVVGSAVGAAGGMFAGPVGGMLGAGAGGALADTATRGAMAYFSPEFRGAAEENLAGMAKDIGINAAIDAGTFGLAKYGGSAIGKVFGKPAGQAVNTAMNHGVISPTVKGAGEVLETLGGGAANVARTMQTPVGRQVASMGVPVASDMTLYGELFSLPSKAMRGIPKAMQWLGETQVMDDIAPQAAKWLRGAGQSIRQAATPSNLAEEGLSRLRVNPGMVPKPSPTAGGVMREVTQRGAQKLGASPGVAKTAGQVANVVGQGADALAVAGKGLSAGGEAITGLGLGSVQAGGRAAQGTGWLLKRAGQATSPFESRAMIQAGGNEFKDYLDRLRKERAKANMDLILAGT